jgi:hypothetical protein
MKCETIRIQLTPEERTLLLRYGYPFERIALALKACEASPDIEIVPMDYFEFERLIGDVCRSINHMNGGAVQNQLLDLCDRLEAAEQSGDGMLGLLRTCRSRRLSESRPTPDPRNPAPNRQPRPSEIAGLPKGHDPAIAQWRKSVNAVSSFQRLRS